MRAADKRKLLLTHLMHAALFLLPELDEHGLGVGSYSKNLF